MESTPQSRHWVIDSVSCPQCPAQVGEPCDPEYTPPEIRWMSAGTRPPYTHRARTRAYVRDVS